MDKKDKDQKALLTLKPIAFKIIRNETKEPKASKLIYDWVIEHYPEWYKTAASVELDLPFFKDD